MIDEDSGEEMVQTSLHTNAVPLRSNRKGYTVLAVACGGTTACFGGVFGASGDQQAKSSQNKEEDS